MLKEMEGFHHRVAIWIAGKTDRCTVDREWEWTPVSDAPEIEGLWPINEYIQRWNYTTEVHIS